MLTETLYILQHLHLLQQLQFQQLQVLHQHLPLQTLQAIAFPGLHQQMAVRQLQIIFGLHQMVKVETQHLHLLQLVKNKEQHKLILLEPITLTDRLVHRQHLQA